MNVRDYSCIIRIVWNMFIYTITVWILIKNFSTQFLLNEIFIKFCFHLSLSVHEYRQKNRQKWEKRIYVLKILWVKPVLSHRNPVTMVLPDRVKQQETANEASHPLSLQCLAWFSYLNQNDRFRRKAPGNLTENVMLMLLRIDQSSGVSLRLHANNE